MTDRDGGARKTAPIGANASDREARWVVIGGGSKAPPTGGHHGAPAYVVTGGGGGGGGGGGAGSVSAPPAWSDRYSLVATTGDHDAATGGGRGERAAPCGSAQYGCTSSAMGNREPASGGDPYGREQVFGSHPRELPGGGYPGTGYPRTQQRPPQLGEERVGFPQKENSFMVPWAWNPPSPAQQRPHMQQQQHMQMQMQAHQDSFFAGSYLWEVHLGTYRELTRMERNQRNE